MSDMKRRDIKRGDQTPSGSKTTETPGTKHGRRMAAAAQYGRELQLQASSSKKHREISTPTDFTVPTDLTVTDIIDQFTRKFTLDTTSSEERVNKRGKKRAMPLSDFLKSEPAKRSEIDLTHEGLGNLQREYENKKEDKENRKILYESYKKSYEDEKEILEKERRNLAICEKDLKNKKSRRNTLETNLQQRQTEHHTISREISQNAQQITTIKQQEESYRQKLHEDNKLLTSPDLSLKNLESEKAKLEATIDSKEKILLHLKREVESKSRDIQQRKIKIDIDVQPIKEEISRLNDRKDKLLRDNLHISSTIKDLTAELTAEQKLHTRINKLTRTSSFYEQEDRETIISALKNYLHVDTQSIEGMQFQLDQDTHKYIQTEEKKVTITIFNAQDYLETKLRPFCISKQDELQNLIVHSQRLQNTALHYHEQEMASRGAEQSAPSHPIHQDHRHRETDTQIEPDHAPHNHFQGSLRDAAAAIASYVQHTQRRLNNIEMILPSKPDSVRHRMYHELREIELRASHQKEEIKKYETSFLTAISSMTEKYNKHFPPLIQTFLTRKEKILQKINDNIREKDDNIVKEESKLEKCRKEIEEIEENIISIGRAIENQKESLSNYIKDLKQARSQRDSHQEELQKANQQKQKIEQAIMTKTSEKEKIGKQIKSNLTNIDRSEEATKTIQKRNEDLENQKGIVSMQIDRIRRELTNALEGIRTSEKILSQQKAIVTQHEMLEKRLSEELTENFQNFEASTKTFEEIRQKYFLSTLQRSQKNKEKLEAIPADRRQNISYVLAQRFSRTSETLAKQAWSNYDTQPETSISHINALNETNTFMEQRLKKLLETS